MSATAGALRGSKKRLFDEPEKEHFPVPWPSEVAYLKKPGDWTIAELAVVSTWLRKCGNKTSEELVSPDVCELVSARAAGSKRRLTSASDDA